MRLAGGIASDAPSVACRFGRSAVHPCRWLHVRLTLAIVVAMNRGFSVTLSIATLVQGLDY
jgi:hypothetical protein